REGLVDWSAALGLGISGAVFAVGGALASDLIGGPTLMVFTAVLMLWSGFSVVRGGRRAAAGPGDEGTAAVDLVVPEHGDGSWIDAVEGTEASETESAFVVEHHEPTGTGPTAGGARGSRHPLPQLVALGATTGVDAGLLGVG